MDPSVADLFDLSSKVALVTGGAREIGRGIAEALGAGGRRSGCSGYGS